MSEKKNMAKINFVQFWDKVQVIPLLTSIKLAPGTAEFLQFNTSLTTSHTDEYNASGLPLFLPSNPSCNKVMKCSHCDTTFTDREEQVSHYSLDWHRFNLKRSMDGLEPVSHKKFSNGSYDKREEDNDSDDASSFEDDDDDTSDNEEVYIRKQPRIFFTNSDHQIVSIFRAVLFNKKAEPASEIEMLHSVSSAIKKLNWIILLIGGGHFAGTIFHGDEVVDHKTFHNYTVRSKQGGSQSSRDNKSATSHPKSAGASLRRYNENVHMQHIQELLSSWCDHLSQCDLVFFRCPKNCNHILFGGQSPPLSRNDFRLRTIPFVTKRASFFECKNVHRTLSQIIIHENLTTFQKCEAAEDKQKKVASPKVSKDQSQSSITKRMTADKKSVLETQNLLEGNSASQSSTEEEITSGFRSMNVRDLDPFGSSVEDQRINKKKKKHKKRDSIENKPLIDISEIQEIEINHNERLVENVVYTACRTGDLSMFMAIYKLCEDKDLTDVSDMLSMSVVSAVTSIEDSLKILDFRFGKNRETLLHVVAQRGHNHFIWWLLENGSDPSITNNKNETPYVSTKNKEARNQFRRFMAQFPNKYDYEMAKISSPLTEKMEQELRKKANDKKKQQKKMKQEKEKEVKKEIEIKRQEEVEKQRFLQMSDREKRALAAERRLASSHNQDIKTSVKRCFQCAQDISTIIPFEYSEYKFCSTICVKEHRIKLKS